MKNMFRCPVTSGLFVAVGAGYVGAYNMHWGTVVKPSFKHELS